MPITPQPAGTNFCRTCGSKLLLKERYRTIKPLGQGGFGKTFLAVDEDKPSQPYCVIKQFFPQAQGTNTVQKAAELFTQEAVRLDELGKHPQIPELLAYFSQDSQQYLVQEFIAGRDLAHELAMNGVFNEARVRSLLLDLLPVIQFVQSSSVIHRDIKPENIILRASVIPQPFQLRLIRWGMVNSFSWILGQRRWQQAQLWVELEQRSVRLAILHPNKALVERFLPAISMVSASPVSIC